MNNHTVTLPQNLKGFAEPNPDSYVAEVPAGEYPLFKILTQYPSSDTDFVQLDLPNTDEDLWVCIRWKEQVYGQIVANDIAAAAPPVNFLSEADLSAVSGPVFHAPEQEQLSVQGPESTQPALLTPQLYVKQPLKSFQSPNTQSAHQGTVPAGTYPVLEWMEGYPNAHTDFVRIALPDLEEGAWLCTRWKDQHYATVVEEATEATPIPHIESIPESALTSLLPAFYDFGYHLHQAYYPYPIPGVKVPQAPPNPPQNNCCTFVEGLVVKAWAEAKDLTWTHAHHADMMIYNADRMFSPVEALVAAGIADAVVHEDDAPAHWTVVQGWRQKKPLRGGHTFIVVAHHAPTDKVLTLESNSYYMLSGVGFRNIGNLQDFPQPPKRWWELPAVPTWSQIKQSYPHRRQARLRVQKGTFAGIE